jgi:hypothetical protein
MNRGSKRTIVAGLAALALLAPAVGMGSAASAATLRGHRHVYAHHYYHGHYRHYGYYRHYRHYYGPGPVVGGILGGLAAGLVAGPYYYGPPYPYYYGPGPYWW